MKVCIVFILLASVYSACVRRPSKGSGIFGDDEPDWIITRLNPGEFPIRDPKKGFSTVSKPGAEIVRGFHDGYAYKLGDHWYFYNQPDRPLPFSDIQFLAGRFIVFKEEGRLKAKSFPNKLFQLEHSSDVSIDGSCFGYTEAFWQPTSQPFVSDFSNINNATYNAGDMTVYANYTQSLPPFALKCRQDRGETISLGRFGPHEIEYLKASKRISITSNFAKKHPAKSYIDLPKDFVLHALPVVSDAMDMIAIKGNNVIAHYPLNIAPLNEMVDVPQLKSDDVTILFGPEFEFRSPNLHDYIQYARKYCEEQKLDCTFKGSSEIKVQKDGASVTILPMIDDVPLEIRVSPMERANYEALAPWLSPLIFPSSDVPPCGGGHINFSLNTVNQRHEEMLYKAFVARYLQNLELGYGILRRRSSWAQIPEVLSYLPFAELYPFLFDSDLQKRLSLRIATAATDYAPSKMAKKINRIELRAVRAPRSYEEWLETIRFIEQFSHNVLKERQIPFDRTYVASFALYHPLKTEKNLVGDKLTAAAAELGINQESYPHIFRRMQADSCPL